MDNGALEIGKARDVRPLVAIDRAVSVDDGVRRDLLAGAVRFADGYRPGASVFVIGEFLDLCFEADVIADAIFLRDLEQVALHVRALRVIMVPVRPDFPAETVEMARRVHTDARIAIFEPGSADVAILLYQFIIIARFAKFDRGRHSGEARADYQHLEPRGPSRAALDFRAIDPRPEAALVEHKIDELVIDGLARGHAHDALNERVGRRARYKAFAFCEEPPETPTQFFRQIFGDRSLFHRECWFDERGKSFQQGRVATQICVGGQERGDVCVTKRAVEFSAFGQEAKALAGFRHGSFNRHIISISVFVSDHSPTESEVFSQGLPRLRRRYRQLPVMHLCNSLVNLTLPCI